MYETYTLLAYSILGSLRFKKDSFSKPLKCLFAKICLSIYYEIYKINFLLLSILYKTIFFQIGINLVLMAINN